MITFECRRKCSWVVGRNRNRPKYIYYSRSLEEGDEWQRILARKKIKKEEINSSTYRKMSEKVKRCKIKRWEKTSLNFRQIWNSVRCMWSSIKDTSFQMQLSFISCAYSVGWIDPRGTLKFEHKCKKLFYNRLVKWPIALKQFRSLDRKRFGVISLIQSWLEGSRKVVFCLQVQKSREWVAEWQNVGGDGSVSERPREMKVGNVWK